ncbi:hypothetical protein [Candidatus Skiveiella danica]
MLLTASPKSISASRSGSVPAMPPHSAAFHRGAPPHDGDAARGAEAS